MLSVIDHKHPVILSKAKDLLSVAYANAVKKQILRCAQDDMGGAYYAAWARNTSNNAAP